MDKEEMERFLREHDWIVKMVIHRCFPSLEGNEDYLQEGRIAMWQSISKWDKARGEFLPFAFSAIRNSINYILSVQARKSGPPTIYAHELELDNRKTDGPDCTFVDLDGWMENLTPEQKQIVSLRLTGYKQNEIGEILNCTRQNVSLYLKHARKSFNEYI